MSRVLRAAAAIGAAVAVLVVIALPPEQRRPASGRGDDTLAGAFHVHTIRSDGRSSPDVVAAAAARAGLKFIVFTDHGDATRKPDPPMYRSGVLCIDAVEISTDDGHLIALGLAASPYPLAGEARDVIEDVHRLGGIGIAAHPDSPKEGLRWRDWATPLDGLEILNLDTVWRRHLEPAGWRTALAAGRSLATYFIRPEETIAAMAVNRGGNDDARRAALLQRRLALFGGVDAHARLDLQNGEPDAAAWSLALPGYEAVFRALTMRVSTSEPLTGEPVRDADLVVTALRQARSYSVFEAILAPPSFEFVATAGALRATQGQELESADPVSLTVRTNAPSSFTTMLRRDGEVLATQPASAEWVFAAPAGGGVYQAEIRASDWPGAPSWLLSNAIFVRPVAPGPENPPPTEVAGLPSDGGGSGGPALDLLDRSAAADRWVTESSPAAEVAFEIGLVNERPEMQMRFGLPSGDVRDEYVAVAAAVDAGLAPYRAVAFRVRSSQPMRASVQIRVPVAPEAHRWRRSFYADETWRTYELELDDFRAAGAVPTPAAPRADVRSLLFVIDQINTKPGTSGRMWLSDVVVR